MTPLATRLREVAARCTKPTKAQRREGCCGLLLGHRDIRDVLELYEAAVENHLGSKGFNGARLLTAIKKLNT